MSDKNSDIEVIGPEDLEDSPPPQDEVNEDVEEKPEDAPEEAGEEVKEEAREEAREEVKEEESTSTTETVGEIKEEESSEAPAVTEASKAEAEDDDPPLEVLTAPEPAPVPAPDPAPVPAPAPNPGLEELLAPARPVVTAARPTATLEEVSDDEEEDDDDLDETIAERLLGLTEMFPDFVRNGTVGMVNGSWGFAKSCYAMSRTVSWIAFSSAALLFMPIMIETERLQLQDQQKAQKSQMLLGPGKRRQDTCSNQVVNILLMFQERRPVGVHR